MALISAMVVTFNPHEEILECLFNLDQIAKQISMEIILVDNASSNDMPQRIEAEFPTITFVHSEANLGFGAGNNLAFKHAQGDYVLCINPDLVLNVEAFQCMLDYLQQNSQVGVVGPKVLNENNQLVKSARATYTLPRLWAKYWMLDKLVPQLVYGKYERKMRTAIEPFTVDWLQGSCLLIRREAFEKVQGFDDEFFLYMEDTDLCERIHQAGWDVIYLPKATVRHYGGTTTSRFHTIRVRSYHLSPLHYHRKRKNFLNTYILKFVFIIELLTKILMRCVFNLMRPNESRKQQIQAEWQVLKDIWKY